MTKRMIIDSSHREETRVVVLDNQKVEEFDFESAAKRPLKGNIYLAKVTRVEPSLQAAFVEYGGNRQGFLAFAEIHPDYYQIPVADRIALLAEQEAEARRRADDDDVESVDIASVPAQETVAEAAALSVEPDERDTPTDRVQEGQLSEFGETDAAGSSYRAEHERLPAEDEAFVDDHDSGPASAEFEATAPEAHPAEGDGNKQMKLQTARPPQRWTRRRHYKIQEVIKRRQVLLVQVVKEERGNKGAALTTYLSLAGRYCVLMPNTPRGGGISRKITSAADRNRLKSAAQSLELPEGMGLIIRTAGENRTKAEIKRDYEYLLRMWDTIRELTLKSNAPACVYEEGDLIKRAIRDLYNKDVADILVEGEDGYRNAKDFMRMLMPSHAKNVKQYKETIPLFQRYQIEAQLDAMFMPTVTLRSGGYIVINQTEALVSIDVNSGKATREHSIEDTAYKTNLEAAEEIARQLRLRDLAGLIVIDFIDMEDARNDRNVEKRLRDCVKNDRARVQIGKISQFGLLEMSRQRLRAGVVAGSTVPCPHCGGQGIVRSVESTALRLLRGLEEEAQRQRAATLKVRTPIQVAIYALNQKRREIVHVETEYGIAIQFEPNEEIIAGTFEIDRIGTRQPDERPRPVVAEISSRPASVPEVVGPEIAPAPASASEESPPSPEQQSSSASGSKRRRRRRRGRSSDTETANPAVETHAALENDRIPQTDAATSTNAPAEPTAAEAQSGTETPAPRKRRRRRRGRRGSREGDAQTTSESNMSGSDAEDETEDSLEETVSPEPVSHVALHAPHLSPPDIVPNAPSEPVWSFAPDDPRQTVSTNSATREEAINGTVSATPTDNDEAPETSEISDSEPEKQVGKAAAPARKGWWQRPFRGE
ncbi:MAG TPA: ribonuclease E/G [Rhizomicrobium sp.]|jgi:ribonuclease E|nr:ribonuclease E/G [Rhizomicrobium sp.]